MLGARAWGGALTLLSSVEVPDTRGFRQRARPLHRRTFVTAKLVSTRGDRMSGVPW